MSIKMERKMLSKIEWRREKIQQLLARGNYSHRDICAKLQLPKTTVTRDIQFLNEEAKANVRKYIDERLPQEYERIMVGLNDILRNIWDITDQAEIETKEKLQAYSLIKECYDMKLNLLTNPSVLEEASSFITKYKDKNKNINNILNNEIETDSEDKKKESKEDYSAESSDNSSSLITTKETTNQVF